MINFTVKAIIWGCAAYGLSSALGITLTWQIMVFGGALSVLETTLDIALPWGARS